MTRQTKPCASTDGFRFAHLKQFLEDPPACIQAIHDQLLVPPPEQNPLCHKVICVTTGGNLEVHHRCVRMFCPACKSHFDSNSEDRIVELLDRLTPRETATLRVLHVKLTTDSEKPITKPDHPYNILRSSLANVMDDKKLKRSFRPVFAVIGTHADTGDKKACMHHVHVQFAFTQSSVETMATEFDAIAKQAGCKTRLMATIDMYNKIRWSFGSDLQHRPTLFDVKRQAVYILSGVDPALVKPGRWRPWTIIGPRSESSARIRPDIKTLHYANRVVQVYIIGGNSPFRLFKPPSLVALVSNRKPTFALRRNKLDVTADGIIERLSDLPDDDFLSAVEFVTKIIQKPTK